MTRRPVTVLDCTLRDGGYYTDWRFDHELVAAYLEACRAAGVDVVELGYVRLRETDSGPFGRLPSGLTPDLRDRVEPPRPTRFAAMVDASDAFRRDAATVGPELAERLACSPLPVETIRVAVHYTRAAETAALVDSLRGGGFRVCLNLMQIDLASPAELRACAAATAAMGPLAALYVADSLGSLHPGRARALVERFREASPTPIGFHAHDNLGLALHNSLVVLDAGATWLDSTMAGMGRGAGNARTEQLLTALGEEYRRVEPVHRFVAQHMGDLKARHAWGSNVFYAIAGLRDIHPTYVQRLEEGGRAAGEKLNALRYLAEAPASSFSAELLREALEHA